MPSAAARRYYEDQIPGYMAVFDLDAETMVDRETVTFVDPKMACMDSKPAILEHPSPHGPISTDVSHEHRNSSSSEISESAEPSPTTTLSTTDSSPLTDGSPSSSPESPIALFPLNNYPSTSFSDTVNPMAMLPIPEAGGPLTRPVTSPGPRRRNMKGLSIQPPSSASSTTNVNAIEPCTPSFIKPTIPAMKRKPSQLSLKTNTSDLIRPTLEMPASPGVGPILERRALKHSTSTPHILPTIRTTIFSPGLNGPSNMLERNESGLSEFFRPMKTGTRSSFDSIITEEDSPIKTQMANRASEFEPYDESDNNEDQKSPSYPDGPVAIYSDNVYLYLEPSAAEASKFDVVFNVAREVRNPFDDAIPRSNPPPNLSPIPDTAVTTSSYCTAFEYPQAEDESLAETPTTPKANPLKIPEYIHMPWDHNTDIASDLMQLCEKIDNRTRQGKKVLIHCQQGASRSASLIIAYGLYQNPDLSVNDAYYAAQGKSRWISPNMKLMYSLQDFQKELTKKRVPPSSGVKPRTGRSPTKHKLTLSADSIQISPQEPRTAPLPGEDDRTDDNSTDGRGRRRGLSTPNPLMDDAVSPGPASAPLSFSWVGIGELPTPIEEQEIKIPPMPDYLPPPPPPASFISIKPADLPQRPKSGMDRIEPAKNLSIDACINPGFLQPRARTSHGFRPLPLRSVNDNPPVSQTTTLVDRSVTTLSSKARAPEMATLMSPRVEAMMNNPIRGFASSSLASRRHMEAPPTPTVGLFSPREGGFPKDPFGSLLRPSKMADPRSPPMRGEASIVRSIDDLI